MTHDQHTTQPSGAEPPAPSHTARTLAWLRGFIAGWHEPHQLTAKPPSNHPAIVHAFLAGADVGQFSRSPYDHEQHI